MVKILLHIHVYYVKSWHRIEKRIKSLVANKSLEIKILTTVSSNINDSDISKIEQAQLPNMSVIRVPNEGYNVQPFFHILKSVSLDEYDYLIKLHTKNTVFGIDMRLNGRFISRIQWQNFLIDAIAGSPKIMEENISRMQSDPTLWMIGSSYCITKFSSDDEEERRLIENYIRILHADEISNAQYIAGTMFMVKTEILKPLIETGLVDEKFEISESHKLGGTKAHAIERIFGILVALNNKKICGFDKSLWKDLITSRFAHALRLFAFDKRITSNGRMLIRICRIPVCKFKYKKNNQLLNLSPILR